MTLGQRLDYALRALALAMLLAAVGSPGFAAFWGVIFAVNIFDFARAVWKARAP